ncbi:MAG: hypothetical protein IPO27_14335 [Bacteroidetes bacterium]|nr:hypothetical protein [Bacteroidota bacterium]
MNSTIVMCLLLQGGITSCTSASLNHDINVQTTPTEVLSQADTTVTVEQIDDEKPEIKMPVGLFVTNSAMDVGFAASTYKSDQIDGVYLRLSWKSVEPQDNQHNWALLDREIQQAVDNNKKL